MVLQQSVKVVEMDSARESTLEWDNRLWEQVWDHNLTQVERYNAAMAVVRHRPPGTPFEDVVARELAHRWGRRALVLAAVYGMWTAFWGALALLPWPEDVEPSPLPLGCAVFGLLAIAACVVARRRFRAYLVIDDA
jgi:hypothetical protein